MLGPFLETLIGGLLTGVLYALVALGFVLIFKASGVFNFAQGAMVLFAALSVARLSDVMPLVLAVACAIVIMVALAYAIEFLVLRRLVNQEGIILFMATLGIAYFLEGFGETIWGSDIYKIHLGIPKEPVFLFESVFPRRSLDRSRGGRGGRRLRRAGRGPCDLLPGHARRAGVARGRR
jgi:branched-chain amino acid transport system permease protein